MIASRTKVDAQRRPDGDAGRARPADRARPLPLRLRRADGEPRPAAALCQRRGRRSSASRRTRSSRSACRRPSTACSRCRTAPAPSASGGHQHGDMWLTGYVTDFLTRAKEQGFDGQPAGLHAGARPAAELHRLRARTSRRAARTGPMRSTCSPATAARRSATCATTPTRASTASRRRSPRRSSAPRWP